MAELTLSNGATLYYEVQGEGPPLVLAAGLSGSATFWNPSVPELAKRFKVILHDHRGTGRSSLDRIEYSVPQMAGDVLALLDHLGIEKAHYVGHSTGGAMGQVLALDHPERIDRLCLSATWAGTDGYFQQLFRVRTETLSKLGPGAYLRANVLFLQPSFYLRDNPDAGKISDADAAKQIPVPEIVLSRIAAIMAHDRRKDLPALKHKTLVVGARDDAVTPAYLSEELGRLIPDAETVIFPNGGHFFPALHHARFREILTGFLLG